MHVLLALDGSRESFEATRQLAQLPFRSKPKITVVSALVAAVHEGMPSAQDVQLREAEMHVAHDHFQQAAEMLTPICESIEHVVESQHPRRMILSAAASRKVDLMVLGARGHSSIHRIVLGSTADYVANHAKCSVMIARPMEDPSASQADHQLRVILAYDGSAESKVAYQQLAEFDWPPDRSHIHIAMVLERPKLIPDEVVYDAQQIAEQEMALRNLNLAQNMGCEVKHSVREALHVGNAIRSIAIDEQRNLVFFGGTGKSAIARFFLGSTSRYFLHHAECTMWIARTNQWDD